MIEKRLSPGEFPSFLDWTREHPEALPEKLVTELPDGTCLKFLDTGVLEIAPPNGASRDLIISSGIHGNETAPMEIVERLVQKILSEQVRVGARLLFLIGNPPAVNLGERFKDINLNRLFNGAWQGYRSEGKQAYEVERAAKLEQYVERFFAEYRHSADRERLHYDLHTAIRDSRHEKFAVYPYLDGRAHSNQQLKFLMASGIDTVLLFHKPSTTFSYHSSHRYRAHAFTIELGKVRPFGENAMSDYAALTANLEVLIRGELVDTKKVRLDKMNQFQVIAEVTKQTENFQFFVDDNTPNFTPFDQGYEIARDENYGYRVAWPEEYVVFPNAKVAPGQRAALMVVPR